LPNYRRFYVPGGTYFFTVVCYRRHPFFRFRSAIEQLGIAMRRVRDELPWTTVATVLIPDHLHSLWSLPCGDADYSKRWKKIKAEFVSAWLQTGGHELSVTAPQKRKGNRGIWQKRFWEHTVRSEDEMDLYVDYIHYNPVKHGLVRRPLDWPWSSFHRFVRAGHYEPAWGELEPGHLRRLDFE
jgi:putative transposase